MKIGLLAFVVGFVLSFSAQAGVKVVDGDSLEVNGVKIRLIGIDSPEYFQTCKTAKGVVYGCGQESIAFMQQLVDEGHLHGKKVSCQKVDTDRYKRSLSLCKMGEVDLNYEMVKSGHAVAYRHDMYKSAEKEAKKAKLGIWQGVFMRPELYRILNKYQKS